MKDYLTAGSYIKEHRENKNMTTNDLAFELSKRKKTYDVASLEKKIKKWENDNDFPTLEEIYDLSFALELNPGELLALRNRGRKQFIKKSGEPKTRKFDWMEVSEETNLVLLGLMRAFIILAVLIAGIYFLKGADLWFGPTGAAIEEEIVERQIDMHTDENYVPRNETVKEFLNRRNEERKNNSIN